MGTVARHARALEALATVYPSVEAVHDLHAPILARLTPLIPRGQRTGDFDRRLLAGRLGAAFLGLMHTAVDEVASDRLNAKAAGRALERTIPRVRRRDP